MPGKKSNLFALSLGALLFFCSADRGLSLRLGSFNVRVGQLLLYLVTGATILFRKEVRTLLLKTVRSTPFWRSAQCLAAFSIAYFISGLMSAHPLHHSVKLVWLLLNISAAFCLAAIAKHFGVLEKGLRIGVGSVTGLLLIDWCLLHLVGTTATIGFFEKSYPFMGSNILRPHGLFYEPSYASCCLAFGALLAFAFRWREAPIIALGVFLVGARSGLLTLAFGAAAFLALGFSKKQPGDLWRRLAKGAGVFAGALVLLWITPGGNRYLKYMAGPMGFAGVEYRLKRHFFAPKGDTDRIKDPFLKERCEGSFAEECKIWTGKIQGEPIPVMSEGLRLDSMVFALKKWLKKPVLGHGVPVGANGKILIDSQSIWLEILVEAGALGFILFLLMMISPWREVLKSTGLRGAVIFVPFLSHILINMNFTQSVARLDYWLLYFLGMLGLLPKVLESRSAPGRQ